MGFETNGNGRIHKGQMSMTLLRPVQERLLPQMETSRREGSSVFLTAINDNPLDNIRNTTHTVNGSFEHGPLVLIRGEISQTGTLPVRIHASFLPGEMTGLMSSDDRDQLNESLRILFKIFGIEPSCKIELLTNNIEKCRALQNKGFTEEI